MPRNPLKSIRRQLHADRPSPETWVPGAASKRFGKIVHAPRTDRNGILTNLPPIDEELLDRLYAADPLGFLIAAMNGQPLPEIKVDEAGKNPKVVYVTLDPAHRADVADTLVRYMASGFFKPEGKKTMTREKPDEFGSIVENAARRAELE